MAKTEISIYIKSIYIDCTEEQAAAAEPTGKYIWYIGI